MDDLKNKHEDEIQDIQDEIRAYQEDNNAKYSEINHELDLVNEKKNSLDIQLSETIANMENIKLQLNNTIEKQQDGFNKERETFILKTEELNKDLSNKNKQIALLQNK